MAGWVSLFGVGTRVAYISHTGTQFENLLTQRVSRRTRARLWEHEELQAVTSLCLTTFELLSIIDQERRYGLPDGSPRRHCLPSGRQVAHRVVRWFGITPEDGV